MKQNAGTGSGRLLVHTVLIGATTLVACASTPAQPQSTPQPPKGPVVPAPATPTPAASPQPTPPASPTPTSPSAPAPATTLPSPVAADAGLREIFPHIRVDAAKHIIEIDGSVPIDAHNEKTPRVYLEVCVCIPDSKEHETLVMTKAVPSKVHAALLLAGLNPGKPGTWDWSGEKLKATPPTGDAVTVTVSYKKDSKDIETPITDWVIDAQSKKSMTEIIAKPAADSKPPAEAGTPGTPDAKPEPAPPPDHFVFAGSTIYKKQGREGYTADIDGTLIGLTTFGGETIAWSHMYNPDSGVEAPHWIADAAKVPEVGTAVVVRIMKKDPAR